MLILGNTYWLMESMMLEIFLLMVIVISLGAAAYTLIFCSLIYDRRDSRKKNGKVRSSNPWDRLTGQEQKPLPPERRNVIFGFVCLGVAIIAGIALALLYIG